MSTLPARLRQASNRLTSVQIAGLIMGSLVCTYTVSLSVTTKKGDIPIPSDERTGYMSTEPRMSSVVHGGNKTLCGFVKQYSIGNDGKRVTVYMCQDTVRMDVRQFNDAKVKEVVLSYQEYRSLNRQWGGIAEDIKLSLNPTRVNTSYYDRG